MIVREGRKLIASGKINLFGDTNPFSKIVFGTSSKITTPEMSATSEAGLRTAFDTYFMATKNASGAWTATLGSNTAACEVSLTPDTENGLIEAILTITLPGSLGTDKGFPIRSLGLIYNDGEKDVLFSRLAFPQYILSNSLGNLVFKYYLDF